MVMEAEPLAGWRVPSEKIGQYGCARHVFTLLSSFWLGSESLHFAEAEAVSLLEIFDYG